MKKLLAYLLTIAITATAAIGGTVAYLQDEDSAVNVMTTGNVYIEQHEYQRADGVAYNDGDAGEGNGVKEGALVPFKQGKAIYPAVPKNNLSTDYSAEATDLFFWGDYVYSGTAGNGLWNDDKLSNVMDKMVFVENTGKSDAYFRTVIAFECPEGMEYSEGPDKEFMMNTNGSSIYKWENIGYTTIDDVRYLLMVATYQNALKPGNTAHPSLLQVVMTHNATNEDMEKLGDTYEILVVSQAVQTEGFADAQTALYEAFGDITTSNHPWLKTTVTSEIGIEKAGTYNLEDDVYTIDSAYFQTQKVTEAVTINGNGATVEGIATSGDAFQWEGGTIAAMSPIFSSANGSKVTVNDLTFTGTMSSISAGHYINSTYANFETEFNNVNIVDAEVVSYSAGVAPALTVFGKMTMNDCVVKGTTMSDLDDAAFTVCDVYLCNYSHTYINGGEIGNLTACAKTYVEINDAEIDTIIANCRKVGDFADGGLVIGEGSNIGTIKVTNANAVITIKSGATVGTIDLSTLFDTSKVTIIVEDGATVANYVNA